MVKRVKSYIAKNGMVHITTPICLNSSPENADWIKVAGWFRTFSDERRLLQAFKGGRVAPTRYSPEYCMENGDNQSHVMAVVSSCLAAAT